MKTNILLLFCCFNSLIFAQTHNAKVEPFLESIVSQFPNVRDLALAENEVVFSAQSVMGDFSALITVKKINNTWSAPEVISFSGQFFDLEPFFSNDGLTLYFASNRPFDAASKETKDFDIWYVDRKSITDNWSEPKNIGAPINTSKDEFYPVITDSKNIYFTLDNPELNQKDNIYLSEFKEGKYTSPELLGNSINTEAYEFNAFISPDESYIIYSRYNAEDGFGSGDLYLSTKLENGAWSASKNMGELVNSEKMDYCPFVDISTNMLYFTSKRLAKTLQIETPFKINELQNFFNQYENGLSRLYKVDITDLLNKTY